MDNDEVKVRPFKTFPGFAKIAEDEDTDSLVLRLETDYEFLSIYVCNRTGCGKYVYCPEVTLDVPVQDSRQENIRHISVYELKEMYDGIMNVLKYGSTFRIDLKGLGRDVVVTYVGKEEYRFSTIERNDNCPLVISQVINRGELWKICNFFKMCVQRHPISLVKEQ